MTVETATFISDLNSLNPGSTDPKAEGDDHLRLLKTTIKATFPNITGPVTATHTLLNNAATGTFGAQAVTGTSFNGKLATANISQFTNDAGYLTSVAAIAWTAVTGKPTGVSAFTNDAGYLTTVGTIAWTSISGRPTALSGLTNDMGFITGVTGGAVTGALGFTPYNATNPAGYISGVTSGAVTGALGFTPYNAANPAGYITSAGTSGVYVPTVTAITNVLSGVATECQWTRIGNNVHVTGNVVPNFTSAGSAEFHLSLPVAATFTATANCGGAAGSLNNSTCLITGHVATNTANMLTNTPFAGNQAYAFSFGYKVA